MLGGRTHPYFFPFPDFVFPVTADFFPGLASFLAAAFFAAGLPLVTPESLGAAAEEPPFAGRPAPLRAPSEAFFIFLGATWSGTTFSGRLPVADRVLRSVGVAGLGLPPRSLKLSRREDPPRPQRPDAAATPALASPSPRKAAIIPARSSPSQWVRDVISRSGGPHNQVIARGLVTDNSPSWNKTSCLSVRTERRWLKRA